MRQIINGKKYDTETATKLHGYWNGLSIRDFGHVEESLYQKKTNEFFIYGYGGPASKYAESCGQNTWSGGSAINPLTNEEAKKWAERYMGADKFESIFGQVEE